MIRFGSLKMRQKFHKRTKIQKQIDFIWEGLLVSEKRAALGKANYEHFIVDPDGASYEVKEAALKAIGRF